MSGRLPLRNVCQKKKGALTRKRDIMVGLMTSCAVHTMNTKCGTKYGLITLLMESGRRMNGMRERN